VRIKTPVPFKKKILFFLFFFIFAGHQWLMPVTPATQEAEIKRILFQSQPGQTVHETLSQKHPSQKRAGGVAQNIGPEFKPQYQKNKNKRTKNPKE
jgi:hypothetical protein